MQRTKIVIALIAVVLMIVLVLQNTRGVQAAFLFFSGNVPLAVLLVFSFIVGVVAGLLLAFSFSGKGKREASAR